MDYKIHNAMHRTTSKQNKSCYSYPQLQNSRPVTLLVMPCNKHRKGLSYSKHQCNAFNSGCLPFGGNKPTVAPQRSQEALLDSFAVLPERKWCREVLMSVSSQKPSDTNTHLHWLPSAERAPKTCRRTGSAT